MGTVLKAIREKCIDCCVESREENNVLRIIQDSVKINIKCPHPEYDGSTWDYCGDGMRVIWNGTGWCAFVIHGAYNLAVIDDPLTLMKSEFWTIKELCGCVSTHEKPMPRNPNKAPDVHVPWDPYGE